MRLLILILLVSACVSCAKKPEPHVTITVSGATSYVLYDNDDSTKEIYNALSGLATKEETPSVRIQLSSDATYELARKALDICSARGLWKISLVDQSGVSIESEYMKWKKSFGLNNTIEETSR